MNDGAIRGVLLVAVAVVIGALLLANGLDDGAATVRSDSGSDDNASTTTTEPDTQTPAGSLDRADIPVVVANGAGIEGAAGAVSDLLASAGYPQPISEDATNPDPTGLDTVYYVTADFQEAALQVASDLGLTPDAVVPIPDPPPADPGLAGVLVVLGSNGTLAPTATGTSPTTPTG